MSSAPLRSLSPIGPVLRTAVTPLLLAASLATLGGCGAPLNTSPPADAPSWVAAPAPSASASASATANPPTASVTPPPAVAVRILAINDLHGNLQPPGGGFRLPDPQQPDQGRSVPAGGVAHLATAVRTLAAQSPHHLFVAAGDLIGASPLLSALFHDEPTVESLGAMGLALAAVGNHEFDRGAAELLRLQRGGCHPVDGCRGPRPFTGARFQYLAASTVDQQTGQTLLPAYAVRHFDGVPVAFIGLTLKNTPHVVVPSGVRGLTFRDEAETVNALVPVLRAQGVEAIVLLIHEGGFTRGGHDECPGLSGPLVDIVRRLDPAVDVVISGHTHQAYNCRLDGRLVTSADKYGTLVSAIDLELDPLTRDVRSSRASNQIVSHERFAADPAQLALLAEYERLAAPLAQRPVARLDAPITRDANRHGESPLGRLVADAQLWATQEAGAQLALMNPGGIRADLRPGLDGQLRFQDLFASQPFHNRLVTLTLSGEQLRQVLEEQWLRQPKPRLLQLSSGLSYRWRAQAPLGQRVEQLRLHGQPVQAQQRLRVTVNAFLADGGDSFNTLRQGSERTTGPDDAEALERYLTQVPDWHRRLQGPARVQRAD
ncbi:bifunctional metallophosphatase/5'-nucleotidase [Ideonella livida]|uniref:Bifunctional metallophosphatase/5'-nucleotidase n=1 Tax=Ideonella livida TaxID=2707176 RepID=A0A7C9PJW4_9BURK|nr:bifunctional metallophosphatase/5'-nucleotidase [Ideonella livida]NDY93877.1 bifunctional metallophosphatase/5'-nucleotidase [Ideonella livida]